MMIALYILGGGLLWTIVAALTRRLLIFVAHDNWKDAQSQLGVLTMFCP